MDLSQKIYVAGHQGMVGSAVVSLLLANGADNLVLKTREELDLTQQRDVENFFATEKPDYVFLAAAKVGGILANNSYPADFLHHNLAIQNNVIHNAYLAGCKKLLFLGSSCIYPRDCPQPIREEYLLTGPLEPTNDAYAIAKIAGIKMCQAYRKQYGLDAICAMPTNLYGPNDNFNLQTSHVFPALIRKLYDAKIENKPSVTIWGTGEPRREFLHVDELAEAVLFLMDNYSDHEIINIGTGEDISIRELSELMSNAVGYEGTLQYDFSKPDGTPFKKLNVNKINALGWHSRLTLESGIFSTLAWYEKNAQILQK